MTNTESGADFLLVFELGKFFEFYVHSKTGLITFSLAYLRIGFQGNTGPEFRTTFECIR
jgi:hypothetical protein